MEVSFKKKNKRGAAGRKRIRRPLDNAEDASAHGQADAVDVEQIQLSIEELREDQRLRGQVLREELASHKAEKPQKKKTDTASDSSQYGLHDPKKDGSTNQKLLTLLDGQFTGQSATTEKDQHEELMNQFIEERLQKKKRTETQQDATSGDDAAAALKTAEDKLFELPEHLKPDVPSNTKGYDDGTEGGMLMGSAGIAEVELPASYSERTEKATRKALEGSKSGGVKLDAIGGLATSALPNNFSTDFNRHRTDYVAEMKNLNKGINGMGCRGWGGLLTKVLFILLLLQTNDVSEDSIKVTREAFGHTVSRWCLMSNTLLLLLCCSRQKPGKRRPRRITIPKIRESQAAAIATQQQPDTLHELTHLLMQCFHGFTGAHSNPLEFTRYRHLFMVSLMKCRIWRSIPTANMPRQRIHFPRQIQTSSICSSPYSAK